MATIHEAVQSLTPDARISLFRLDTSSLGGPVYYFCQSAESGKPVEFGTQEYLPVDLEFKGMETNGSGAIPMPTVTLSNTNGAIQKIVNQYGDLLGCEFRRVRVFARHLDGGEDADATAYFGPDIFRVERKSVENPLIIEWELSASIDQEGRKLPGRRVIRDTCLWRYRHLNDDGNFDYEKAQCPYTGSQYFDTSGVACAKEDDRCGRRLSDCELRFGVGQPLPFGGFPGAGRVS